MAEYIDRDALLAEAKRISGPMTGDGWDNWGVYALINRQPAADVRPVVRGKWVLEYEPNGKPYCFHCSVCDGDFHYIGITTKYDFCPNCGADMRGET